MGMFAKIVTTLVVIGLVVRLWVPLLLIGTAWAIYRYGVPAWRSRVAAYRAGQAELVSHADQQHNWVLQGDDRGVYGEAGAKLMRDIA